MDITVTRSLGPTFTEVVPSSIVAEHSNRRMAGRRNFWSGNGGRCPMVHPGDLVRMYAHQHVPWLRGAANIPTFSCRSSLQHPVDRFSGGKLQLRSAALGERRSNLSLGRPRQTGGSMVRNRRSHRELLNLQIFGQMSWAEIDFSWLFLWATVGSYWILLSTSNDCCSFAMSRFQNPQYPSASRMVPPFFTDCREPLRGK